MRVNEILFGGASTTSPLGDIGVTLLRVFLGLALAFGHGLGKVQAPEKFLEGVAKLGLPMSSLFGWAAIGAEFLGGLLLALGLLTRPAAFLILSVMLVAVGGVHWADPFAKKELALHFGFGALAFLFFGSGRYGLDSLVRGGQGGARRRQFAQR